MNKRIARAALMACLLGTAAVFAVSAPLAPAYAKPSGPTVSTPVGKLLQPAQKAMTDNNFADALTLVKQAQALPDQTPFDTYKIHEFAGNIYVHQNDHVNAEIEFSAMADSPALGDVTPEERSGTLRIAALLSTEQKHYDNGIKYGTAFLALGGAPDPTVLASMSQAYYYKDDYANAAAYAQKSMDATPAGQAPNEGALQIQFGSLLKAKKTDEAVAVLEKIVTYYDDADEWGQLVDVALGTKGIKDVDALHMYRLRLLSKAKGTNDDFAIPAQLALSLTYAVEAQAFLDAGSAAGVLETGGKTGAQVAETRSRAAKDRASMAEFEGMARKSATGEYDLKLAESLYGYGRFADSAEAANRALTKGGAKADPNEANMVLGEALLRQGKTAEAIAAFNAVKNGSPAMMRAQHLWLLWANRKVAAPT